MTGECDIAKKIYQRLLDFIAQKQNNELRAAGVLDLSILN